MVPRLLAIFVGSALLVSGAAKKTTATARGENDDVILNVTIYIDSAAVKEALGDDLGGHYIVAQVKVEPKCTEEIKVIPLCPFANATFKKRADLQDVLN